MLNNNNKSKLLRTGISCATVFVILYLITNLSAITGFLSSVFSVLSPIAVGAAIAYMLNPILKLFEYKILKKLKSKSARRALSLVLTYVVAVLILTAFFLLMIPQLVQSIKDLTEKFDSYIAATTTMVNSVIYKLSDTFNISPVDSAAMVNEITDFFADSSTFFNTVIQYLKSFGVGLFVGIKNTVLGIFISIYMLIDKERLHAQVRRLTSALFKDKTRIRVHRYARTANRTFGGFFIGKIVDSVIIGFLTFFVLLIFRMPYAPLVSAIIGITNIIPIFGPIIGAIPSAFIIFIASPQKALLFLILILLIQQLDGNVIGPKILGNSTGISSLGVIIAIIVMGEYFGVVGMIVGVPIFATVLIFINEMIEEKLTAKGLPTSADEYFPAYSLVDPHERHEKLGERIFHAIFGRFAHLIKNFIKKRKNKKAGAAEQADQKIDTETNQETQEPKEETSNGTDE